MPRARTHRIGLFAPPVSAAPADTQEDEFVASAAQTVFALSQTSVGGIKLMWVNGQAFKEGSDFDITGSTGTWTGPFPLVAGDCVVFVYNY